MIDVPCIFLYRAATADGSTCSALIPPLMGENVIIAKASFSRVLRGAVYLVSLSQCGAAGLMMLLDSQVQEDFGFDQYGNTHVIVDAYYADPNTNVSLDHASCAVLCLASKLRSYITLLLLFYIVLHCLVLSCCVLMLLMLLILLGVVLVLLGVVLLLS